MIAPVTAEQGTQGNVPHGGNSSCSTEPCRTELGVQVSWTITSCVTLNRSDELSLAVLSLLQHRDGDFQTWQKNLGAVGTWHSALPNNGCTTSRPHTISGCYFSDWQLSHLFHFVSGSTMSANQTEENAHAPVETQGTLTAQQFHSIFHLACHAAQRTLQQSIEHSTHHCRRLW